MRFLKDRSGYFFVFRSNGVRVALPPFPRLVGTNALRDDPRVLQGSSTRSLVLMLPALQALAALRGRDYVAAEDLETLVPRVLAHRIELAPGVVEIHEVLDDALRNALEGLARSTLARR